MENIHLQQTLPQVFAVCANVESEVWCKDISLHRGERLLIEAGSGSGKSSLCSYLYGSRKDFMGRILFDDRDITELTTNDWSKIRRDTVSILFQDLRLFPELNVIDNILIKNKLTNHKSLAEINQLLEAMGIADKCNREVGRLSIGEQQRVAFIRSLCQPFDFILMDEPISHLDAANAAIMSELLLAEVNKSGAGVVVTSVGNHLELPYNRKLKL